MIRIANVLKNIENRPRQRKRASCTVLSRLGTGFFPSMKHSEKLTWENAKLFLSAGNKPLIHRGNQKLANPCS